jgi:hypothetical protein
VTVLVDARRKAVKLVVPELNLDVLLLEKIEQAHDMASWQALSWP